MDRGDGAATPGGEHDSRAHPRRRHRGRGGVLPPCRAHATGGQRRGGAPTRPRAAAGGRCGRHAEDGGRGRRQCPRRRRHAGARRRRGAGGLWRPDGRGGRGACRRHGAGLVGDAPVAARRASATTARWRLAADRDRRGERGRRGGGTRGDDLPQRRGAPSAQRGGGVVRRSHGVAGGGGRTQHRQRGDDAGGAGRRAPRAGRVGRAQLRRRGEHRDGGGRSIGDGAVGRDGGAPGGQRAAGGGASGRAAVSAGEAPGAPRLRRELGVLGLAATGICSMVGAGINIVPFAIQRTVPGIGDWVLPAYAIAAVPAVLAALCYAALGSAMPRAGGSYVYASRALNAHAGFLASFSQWFGLCMAIGVVAYVIPPFLRDIAVAAGWDGAAAALGARPVRLALALTLLWSFVLVNLRGVEAVARTLVPLMVLMFLCGGMVIVTGATHDPADYAALLASRGEAVPASMARGDFWGVVPAGAAVLFSSFIGFDAIAQAGGEARNPSRSIPLAVGAAIVTVGAFYFAFTAAVYHAVPWPVVADASLRGDVTAPGLLTPLVSAPVALLMVSGAAVSLINDLPGMLLGVSRLCFAWAEDGVFPAGMAAVHPRHRTPHVALAVSALLATASVLGGHLADDFFVGVDILVTAMLVNFL
ncbi:MAG: APC family permease, partial [Gemmatimonadetes bacterium]|nr:APC family permease [Gemmatimonadota bacterium]